MEEKENTHGGHRSNSGAKKKPPTDTIAFRVYPELKDLFFELFDNEERKKIFIAAMREAVEAAK